MKKFIIIYVLVCLYFTALAQTNSLLGRWEGEYENQKLTLVFAANSKGVWKVIDQFDSPDIGCACSVTVSATMTWKIKSNKVFIDVSKASGSVKMIKNDSKYAKVTEGCVSTCQTLLDIIKSGVSKKYSDDLIFEGRQKVWMLGIEFTKSDE